MLRCRAGEGGVLSLIFLLGRHVQGARDAGRCLAIALFEPERALPALLPSRPSGGKLDRIFE